MRPIICPMCGAGLQPDHLREAWDSKGRYYVTRYYDVACRECGWVGTISTKGDNKKWKHGNQSWVLY